MEILDSPHEDVQISAVYDGGELKKIAISLRIGLNISKCFCILAGAELDEKKSSRGHVSL
jgi:hypothetical protein